MVWLVNVADEQLGPGAGQRLQRDQQHGRPHQPAADHRRPRQQPLQAGSSCWVALGFTWLLLVFTGFHFDLLDHTSSSWVLLGLTGFDWVSFGFTRFYWVLPFLLGFTCYSLISNVLTSTIQGSLRLLQRGFMGSTGLYLVLSGFAGFCWVLDQLDWCMSGFYWFRGCLTLA